MKVVIQTKKEATISDCLFVTPTGFKPITPTSVVWYSIQLSYGAIAESEKKFEKKSAHDYSK